MIFKCTVVLCLLAIDLSSTYSYNEGYSQYQGPPAPLNPDGTVAFTPEYQHIRDEHRAAFEREYQKIQKIRNSINPADQYTVPHYLKANGNEDQGQYLPEIHEEEHYDSSSPVENEGQYHPDRYEKPYNSLYEDGQYRPHLYEQEHQLEKEQYSSPPSAQGTSYRPSYAPATLNADGTVAHTPAYNSIASSFLAYHQALSRHRRSTERYQGPPAPLNHDLTVDYTPEVKHVSAAHFSAVADQFKRLQTTAALAAAHPDRTSPPSTDYNPQSNAEHIFVPHGHHQGQYLARKKRSYADQYRSQLASARYHDDGLYRSHLLKHDDGQYKHQDYKYDDGQYKHHQRKYDDGQYRPHLHKHEDGQYEPHLHQVGNYNSEPFRPAPLNPDGTVAHVPAIAVHRMYTL